jgi:F0F1-type ATP synthase assembly protein I
MLPESGDRKELARYMALSQVGMEMVVPVVIGVALDYYLGWRPWGVIAGAVLGLIAGLAHLISLANKANNERDKPSGGQQTR